MSVHTSWGSPKYDKDIETANLPQHAHYFDKADEPPRLCVLCDEAEEVKTKWVQK